MTALRQAWHKTFRSVRVRNYRIYFIAQLISVSGTWMQSIAQAWLVLHLSGSGVDLGIVTGLQFLPVLLFGPVGGLVADRVDKRHLLYATQTAAGLLALALGILDATHAVQLWQVYLLAAGLGVVNLFDNPARQTFVMEMVGRDDLPNAVSLSTVVMNVSRVAGPAIGGIIIVVFGLSVCFFVNAVSYGAVVIGLSLMRAGELHRAPPVQRGRGQIRDGFGYVWRNPSLRNTLIAMAVIGVFAYNFTVTLALMARTTFHGGAGTYSLLTSCMGAGAIVGGLLAAHRARPTPRLLHTLALVFGALLCGVAVAPSLALAAVVIVFMGAASIGFVATANATLQLQSEPAMRGRVMSLYAMAFLGSTPIGAPLVGAIAEWSNPRVAMALGGVATLLAAGVLTWRHRALATGLRFSPPSMGQPASALSGARGLVRRQCCAGSRRSLPIWSPSAKRRTTTADR
ncbi:MAG: MFS transporter [Acidimicrobiales bacterium]